MYFFIAIGAIILFVALYFISTYNKLVKLRNLVQEAWSGINVFLKKRYDLIPNLVETVKGYATHERETFEKVTQARSNALEANSIHDKQTAEKQLNQALVNLLALSENYPELKANTNFQQLQSELTQLETEIEKSRRYYNGTTRDFNTLIESFPSNIVANMFHFEKSEFFELDSPEERIVPSVKF
jgi:LemA protein